MLRRHVGDALLGLVVHRVVGLFAQVLLLLEELFDLLQRLLDGGERIVLALLGLGDHVVEVLANVLERLVRLGLRLGRLGRLVLPKHLVGLVHLLLGRRDLLGQLGVDLVEQVLGVAGLMLDAALLVAGLLHLAVGIIGRLGRGVLECLRVFLDGFLGGNRVVYLLACFTQRFEAILGRAKLAGQLLQVGGGLA